METAPTNVVSLAAYRDKRSAPTPADDTDLLAIMEDIIIRLDEAGPDGDWPDLPPGAGSR
jgi:hypothetical protein